MSKASSPCIGVCAIDGSAALCLGCGRTLDEIAGWGALSEPRRLAIMAALPARLREGAWAGPSTLARFHDGGGQDGAGLPTPSRFAGGRRAALDARGGDPHLDAGGGGSERWTGAS